MSKVKKDSVKGESLEHDGDKPAEVVNAPSALVSSIQTEEQARALVKTLYAVPNGCKTVYVTEDRNVFWQDNRPSAVNHAQRRKLKLFTLSWD